MGIGKREEESSLKNTTCPIHVKKGGKEMESQEMKDNVLLGQKLYSSTRNHC